MTDRARFSRLVRHPARKRSGYGAGLFLHPRSPHGMEFSTTYISAKVQKYPLIQSTWSKINSRVC